MIDLPVVCDLCNEYFAEDDNKTGGFVLGSTGICPLCEPQMMKSLIEEQEEHFITFKAEPGETHYDFIQRVRTALYLKHGLI